jgi:hypothetical protein
MTIRETGQASKVLEMRLFYKVWVTSVFAKKRLFMSFSTFVAKYHRGSALKLSRLSHFPHGTESHHRKIDAYNIKFTLDNIFVLEYE